MRPPLPVLIPLLTLPILTGVRGPAAPVVPGPPSPTAPAVTVPAPPPTWDDLLADDRTVAVPRRLRMLVTAYCPGPCCCGVFADGLTAGGLPVTADGGRFVAADTDVLPLGTILRVPGYHDARPVEVLDRGSAIRGARLDVFFPTHTQAAAWGVRELDVLLILR